MKPPIKKMPVLLAALVATCFAFMSFTAPKGGEGFEIFLDNKVVLQKFGNQMNTVSVLELDAAAMNGELQVKYHHCGQVGKNRVITITNGEAKVLKTWRYDDAKQQAASMSCSVKEIITLQSPGTEKLNLYYSSSELPGGRLLVSIVPKAKAVVKL
jgi:hypothetical protein